MSLSTGGTFTRASLTLLEGFIEVIAELIIDLVAKTDGFYYFKIYFCCLFLSVFLFISFVYFYAVVMKEC